SVDGNFVISSNAFSTLTAGEIELLGVNAQQNQLNLNNNDLSNAAIHINSAAGAVWTVNGSINAGAIIVQQGGLIASNTTMKVSKLIAISASAKEIDTSNSGISGEPESSLNSASLTLNTTSTTMILAVAGSAPNNCTTVHFDATLNTGRPSA